jgi:hypothetical protein
MIEDSRIKKKVGEDKFPGTDEKFKKSRRKLGSRFGTCGKLSYHQ